MKRRIIANSIIFSDVARLIAEGRSVRIAVKGNSMRPFIFHGESVELHPFTVVEVGDIVVAQNTPDHYVLHRIIAIEGEFVTLQGDGNLEITEECLAKNIIAKVHSVERRSGRVVDLRTPSQRRWGVIWRWLHPVRRYLLFAGHHLLRWP